MFPRNVRKKLQPKALINNNNSTKIKSFFEGGKAHGRRSGTMHDDEGRKRRGRKRVSPDASERYNKVEKERVGFLPLHAQYEEEAGYYF